MSHNLAVQATPACTAPYMSCNGHGHFTEGTVYAWPELAGHTACRTHIQDKSSLDCTVGYKADLLVYIHVVYNFILDLDRLIHFALVFYVCFSRLKSSWPIRNGFVTANKADLLMQKANCKLGNVSTLTHLLEHYFSRLHERIQY